VEVAHDLGGLAVGDVEEMGVGPQGDGRVGVAEAAGERSIQPRLTAWRRAVDRAAWACVDGERREPSNAVPQTRSLNTDPRGDKW